LTPLSFAPPKKIAEFLAAHLYIVDNLAQQARTNGFTRMEEHNGAPSIRVPQEGHDCLFAE
jgi:hypothetical protein